MPAITLKVVSSIVYFPYGFAECNRELLRGLTETLSVKFLDSRPDGAGHHVESLVRYFGDEMGFPLGVYPEVASYLKGQGYEVEYEDRRPPRPPQLNVQYVGHPPRDYQEESCQASIQLRGLMTCRGIHLLPVRAGKTGLGAMVIAATRMPAVYTVPNLTLLDQVQEELQRSLEGVEIGVCGGGVWRPGPVTVATVQTLMERPLETIDLLARSGLLIGDEIHHFDGPPAKVYGEHGEVMNKTPAWRRFLLSASCRYKIGYTGTAWFGDEEGEDSSSIWLRAIFGPVLNRVSMSRLMRLGILKTPTVLVYPIPFMGKPKEGREFGSSWDRTSSTGIVTNHFRNAACVDLAEHAAELGLRAFIDSGRTEQVKELATMLGARELPHAVLVGSTGRGLKAASRDDRKRHIAALRANRISVLTGTVLGEGVNIPELEVVVNAEGGKAKGRGRAAVIQRLRNLTAVAGKGDVFVIDFYDMGHHTLEEHSQNRIALYESIRGFKVIRVPWKMGEKFRLPAELFGGTTSTSDDSQ